MVVITAMYPLTPGTRFDMDYYINSHLALARELFEPMGQRDMRLYKGLSDGASGEPTFGVIVELFFDDMDSLIAAMTAHGAAMQADVANFTDTTAVVQLSEMVAL